MGLQIIIDSTLEIVRNFLAQLPNILLGVVAFIIFLLLARAAEAFVRRVTGRGLSEQAGIALGRIAKWVVVALGLLTAMAIIFPSVDIATLVGALGVTGVAVGFAFRDILQNFFAGLILLLTEPFQIGDQIAVGDFEGTVKKIETRATVIHTYDSRDVIIPNAELFIDSVVVNTAHNQRRSQYDVGIGYGDDIELAKRLMIEAMQEVEGVLADPQPEALLVELADFAIVVRARWWTAADRASVINIHDSVLFAIAQKLVSNGIDLPFPTQMVLFHDQTEETDGDRARQREGWPVPREGSAPRPQRIVDGLRQLTGVSGNGVGQQQPQNQRG